MAGDKGPAQLDLFGAPPKPVQAKPARARVNPVGPVQPAEHDPELAALAARLPSRLRLGTSSWSFTGWAGHVYASGASQRMLSREGLAAYAAHPLMRTVCVDRGFYEPLPLETWQRWASQVPGDFRFVVKAHEWLTLARFPTHPRYGDRGGRPNPHFLDADYAVREVVEPMLEGLDGREALLLCQFPPQRASDLMPRGPDRFHERLSDFLAAVSAAGVRCAVELRRAELLTPAYAAALTAAGAVHCVNHHPSMPDVTSQWHRGRVREAPELVIRWMLASGRTYEGARDTWSPFDRLAGPDPATRAAIAHLALDAIGAGQEVTIIVNNKAEGCSPLSVVALANLVADLQRSDRAG